MYYVPFQSIRATLTLQMQNGTARTLLRLYIIIMVYRLDVLWWPFR